ncbi:MULTISPECIES: hypothetical protein [unclassified Lysobacter]|uniref:hypothetical protein n=1 Tax=unclassified Lysobacter TaxID=2635362 RepID=UPI001BEC0ADB|nr:MULTISPECIES: hypothetical protein [unclassified Lysobacter]MBT2748670.1 hypothetical protein [Lysobacter sp. ISL-42]MBT2751605.1 hypothetical protein [Lysobacter sp. ISL-50]MBT2775799.1 hypothetical protein [Lysobacter sp. ISL-54]MBT2782236.1 hypothetical protein [Lysobacter sp. ISL-52]
MTDSVVNRQVIPVYEPPRVVVDPDTQAQISRAVTNVNPAEGMDLLRARPELAPQIADAALRGGNYTLAHVAQTTPANGQPVDRIVPAPVSGAVIGLGYRTADGLSPISVPTPAAPDIVSRLPQGPGRTRVPIIGDQVLIPNSTSHARTDFARQIAQTPGHPLNFLVNPASSKPQLWRMADIPFFSGTQPLHGEYYKNMGPGLKTNWMAEFPFLTQMAHSESDFSLKTTKDSQIVLDTALNNQHQGTYHESKGSIVSQGSAVVVDGTPASNAAIEEWKTTPISAEMADQLKGNVRPDGTPYKEGQTLLREEDLAGRNVSKIKLGGTPQETQALNKPAGSIDTPSTAARAPTDTPNRFVTGVDKAVAAYDNVMQPVNNAIQPLKDATNRVLAPIEKASQVTVDAAKTVTQPAVDAVKKTAAPVLEAVQPVVSRAKPVLEAVGKVASRAALPVAAALDAYNIATAQDKPKAIVSVAGGWAGAAAGAAAGSALGPVGTIVGGAIGYLAGSGLAEKAYEGVKSLWNSVFG